MSSEIIQRHMNGHIAVSNKEFELDGSKFKGANFIIKLPTKKA